MQDLINMVLGSQSSGAVQQIASKFNLDESQANNALKELLPSLKQGIQSNVQQQGGLESLIGALSNGKNEQYIEQPEKLLAQDATTNGNAILGHLLGNKETSRQVAQQASNNTGIDSGIMKQILPIAATMLMGSLGKESNNQTNPQGLLQGLLGDSDGSKDSLMGGLSGLAGKLIK